MKKTFTTIVIALLTVLALPATGAFAAENPAPETTQKATVTFTGGALTLDGVSSIDFGVNPINGTKEDFEATSPVTAKVTDLTGSEEGWTLSLSQDEDLINGGTITLGAGTVKLTAGTDVKDTLVAPTSTLKLGAATQFATKGKAPVGVYDINVAQKDVNLNVPVAKQITGDYVNNLTWNLTQGALGDAE